MSSFWPLVSATLLLVGGRVEAALDLAWGDDSDLTNFVTRPEIRTPKFNVTLYEKERLSPGYWFIAPYSHIFQEKHATGYYQPCQTGPSIYDNTGELVWSGACQVKNQNTCDFRAWEFNGSFYTSAILTPFRDVNDPQGHGILLDNSFQTVGELPAPIRMHNLNMHELNLLDNGTKAIHILHEPIERDLSDVKPGLKSGWVMDIGFREIDLITGELTFEWWASRAGNISFTESNMPLRRPRSKQKAWNWFHGNSVDKNEDGDYMVSSRFTDTIYKISGKDGSVIWRLGGNMSSFDQDFAFSRQHDARWLEHTTDKEVISFLNNGADDVIQNSPQSAALIVELDKTSMMARAVKRIKRPDDGVTRMRGNHQVLKNGNSFVCWSENSYISEHDSNGDLLMEAEFASSRFVTYRAYKFNFTSVPAEPPVMKAFVYGTSPDAATSVFYVSWNGATEVSSWRFKSSDGKVLGEKQRTGFETSFQATGCHRGTFVEAVAVNGSIIGTSPVVTVIKPQEWDEEVEDAKLEASTVSPGNIESTVSDSSGVRTQHLSFSDDGLPLLLSSMTLIMICVGVWFWRCNSGGRSRIRLRSVGATSKVVDGSLA